MGDQDQAMMAYVPEADEPDLIAALAGHLDHVQRHLLYVGCILVIGGWLVVTCTISNRAAKAEHALVGLGLLLLGAFLRMLWPEANQFPAAARAGATVADAVFFYFFAPAN